MRQSIDRAQLLELAAASPQTAAVLVAAGLLDKLLQAEQASPVDSPGQLGRNNILQQLLRAAEDVAQQPAAAAGSEADAAAAVAEAAAALKGAVHGSSTDPSAQSAHAAASSWLLTASRLAGPLLAWWHRFSGAHADGPSWLPPARRLATALLAWWRRPEVQQVAVLEAAQAAAARSCAYLCCANLSGEGGPAAGQGNGSQKCRWDDGRLQGTQDGWLMLLWLLE